jgi:hypothetical protein
MKNMVLQVEAKLVIMVSRLQKVVGEEATTKKTTSDLEASIAMPSDHSSITMFSSSSNLPCHSTLEVLDKQVDA